MNEQSRTPHDDTATMRVDGTANADLGRRLSEIARRVDAMGDEVMAVGLVVGDAMGQGAPAAAFRPGALRAEQGCSRGVEGLSQALTVIADNAVAGATQVVEVDRELDAQFRTSGQIAGSDRCAP
ncbi:MULTISPECIES: hypothetical protein [Gordonia]|uniref:Uncharacterized protein n=1 Tax=Gordonia sputi NBRC 100414 TaxID=1089453 RepID=H5TZA1_9ACTN|nr:MULTISPECIES: hypothetical protein [Gordonia]NKY93960.1 hypothetical protein [Gordonia sputi]OBA42199.1 hypothetical protein A5766_19390 [Gordonia sp. 852002-51296_SCH5728562-b]GAB38809.1 hypothetical protein GOSPT_051_00610 [Gordonia sputi NBRC 100414]